MLQRPQRKKSPNVRDAAHRQAGSDSRRPSGTRKGGRGRTAVDRYNNAEGAQIGSSSSIIIILPIFAAQNAKNPLQTKSRKEKSVGYFIWNSL